ncbi:hypothetical protein [Paenibacillus glycanilyticus]|uniref:DUF58 domain-containing protein n=1 Tax=Paenibacillus glycanilyticus TaxID=126569 RepID=A0ABQ6GDJ5_9BACL|nr:hypothetical protein [Paenibacillus glycanilyticus]GLX67656.1 hypothetical protein MU1_20010 [Paenibacillus glycanilyticus]
MFLAQRIAGFAAVVFGLIMMILGLFWQGAIVAFAGFVLASLAELVLVQQSKYHLALGLPYKDEQINLMLKRSTPVKVSSGGLSIHPLDGTAYPLLQLHGDYYLRAKAFIAYIEQNETEYRFAFPDVEPVLLASEPRCRQGSSLFQFNDQVFVKLSALPLAIQLEGDRLRIEVQSRSAQL